MISIKVLRWLFIVALTATVIAGLVSSPKALGFSSTETIDSHGDRFEFEAGTSPWAIVWIGPLISLYFLLMKAPNASPGQPLPGVIRRYGAFWLDFILLMIITGPIVGIPPILSEWRRTGVFQWQIERTFSVPSDSLNELYAFLFIVIVFVVYEALPLTLGKPSPGECMCGYQILSDYPRPIRWNSALLRALVGFAAAVGGPIALFYNRDPTRGKIWIDKYFDTHAALPD